MEWWQQLGKNSRHCCSYHYCSQLKFPQLLLPQLRQQQLLQLLLLHYSCCSCLSHSCHGNHKSRVLSKISNLIKKKVSKMTERSKKHDGFSPFVLHCCLIVMYSCRQWQQCNKNWSMGCDIMCGAWALKVEFH